MIVADDADPPVIQSTVDRGSGGGVCRGVLVSVFITRWPVEGTETGRTSVSVLLGDQLVLEMSGTEVLSPWTPEEVEIGIEAVVSEGLNVLTLVYIFSAEAEEGGVTRLVPVVVTGP